MESNVEFRIQRMYAALNSSREVDLQKIETQWTRTEKGHSFFTEFSSGESPAELYNHLSSVLGSIMTLRDILTTNADALGITRETVENAFRVSESLKIVRDLRVANEHGWPPNTSWTGQKPKIENLRRVMALSVGTTIRISPKKGVTMTGGNAATVLEAEIVSETGEFMADLSAVLRDAVSHLESFLESCGIVAPD